MVFYTWYIGGQCALILVLDHIRHPGHNMRPYFVVFEFNGPRKVAPKEMQQPATGNFPNRVSPIFSRVQRLAEDNNATRVLVFGLGSAQSSGLVIDALLGDGSKNPGARAFLGKDDEP